MSKPIRVKGYCTQCAGWREVQTLTVYHRTACPVHGFDLVAVLEADSVAAKVLPAAIPRP